MPHHRGTQTHGSCSLLCDRWEGKDTCFDFQAWNQFDDRQAARVGYNLRWRRQSRLHHENLYLEISKVCGKFIGAVCRIERYTCRARRHGEERHGHLWAIGDYQRDPIIAVDPHGTQRLAHVTNVPM